MPNLVKNLRNKFSDTKPADFIYPGIILIFTIIVGILFFTSARFITKNINDAFSEHPAGNESSLNMLNYTLVAKKLGISLEHENTQSTQIVQVVEPSAISTTTPTQILDRKSITIRILNSTDKKGVATELSTFLESLGFSKAKLGDERKKYATTTLILKEGKKGFSDEILIELQKKYSYAIASSTPDTALYDATIIIGEK